MLPHRRPASKKSKHLTIAEFIMTQIETSVKRQEKHGNSFIYQPVWCVSQEAMIHTQLSSCVYNSTQSLSASQLETQVLNTSTHYNTHWKEILYKLNSLDLCVHAIAVIFFLNCYFHTWMVHQSAKSKREVWQTLIEYMSRREKATTQSPLRTCEYDPNALVWGTSGDRRSYCLTWFQVPKEWVKENALLYLHLQHCFNKAVQLPV